MSRLLCISCCMFAWLALSGQADAAPTSGQRLVAQQNAPPPPGDEPPQDGVPQGNGGGRYQDSTITIGRPHRRRTGIGTAFGGGVAGGVTGGTGTFTPQILLPTIELRFFRGSHRSIDLQIPVLNMVVPLFALAFGGVLVLPLGIGVYYSMEFGRGNVRFILSPGAQLSAIIVSAQGTTAWGFEVRPGVALGLLVLTKSRRFEFQLRARPFLGIGLAAATAGSGAASGFAFSGGALAELAFNWY